MPAFIERQHLLILREADRLGSVTAAADVLNLSQSALSHAIRKFEDRSGVKIWERDGRGRRLTRAGHYLLSLSERVLAQMEHAERTLQDYATGQRGALRAGMECHPCQQWLMRVVAPYLQAWPLVEFDIQTTFRAGGLAALLTHEIDVLITPDPQDHPDLTFTRIFDYELLLAVPQNHPIAAVATPQDLLDQILITYPAAPERLDIFTRFLIPAGCRPLQHRRVESTDMMLQLVAAGRAISAVPDWILREQGQGLPVRSVRLGEGMPMALHIGLRTEDSSIAYLGGFLSLARSIGQAVRI